MIRLRRQSHSQWGCSQTPSLKFHHPTAFPVPSSALLITPAHINLQHSCLSSLHLNGSSMKAGSFVFYFLLYPQWWKQCLSHNRHWMKESKLLHHPCQRLFWQWAAPIGQFWANETWGETCQKRKASPSPARYEHRSICLGCFWQPYMIRRKSSFRMNIIPGMTGQKDGKSLDLWTMKSIWESSLS